MAAAADNHSNFYSPYKQQKYSNCYWEVQPEGCKKVSCALYHSKPRYINGLFLPPSNTPLSNQENILLPIHPPLIISLNDREDEDEDEEDDEEEENYVSEWVPQSAADIEEEKAIKEICFKTGEYYRIQHPDEHQSTKTVVSSQTEENKRLPLTTTKQDLQKGGGKTILTKLSNTERGRENSGIYTSDRKVKPSYKQTGQRKADEAASSIPHVREIRRNIYFNSAEPRRSTYVVHRTVNVTQEPKLSRYKAESEPHGGKSSKQKNQLDTNRRFGTQKENYENCTSGSYNSPNWRKRNTRAKTPSKFKTTIQSQGDTEVNKKGERYIERKKC